MNFRLLLSGAAACVLATACAVAPQLPVELAPDAVGPQGGRVGVAMTKLPAQDTEVPGAGCLLCLAVASAANSALTDHARKLPYEDLPRLKDQVAELLRKKGTDAVVIAGDLDLDALSDAAAKGTNIAARDFKPLKTKLQVDRLLVMNVDAIGFTRSYSGYVPTTDPRAMLRGAAYIVNLSTNAYEWYAPVNVTKTADGPWDEPPNFPGLSNAYFYVLETSKDRFLEKFRQ
jgi:hypothetical protein